MLNISGASKKPAREIQEEPGSALWLLFLDQSLRGLIPHCPPLLLAFILLVFCGL